MDNYNNRGLSSLRSVNDEGSLTLAPIKSSGCVCSGHEPFLLLVRSKVDLSAVIPEVMIRYFVNRYASGVATNPIHPW